MSTQWNVAKDAQKFYENLRFYHPNGKQMPRWIELPVAEQTAWEMAVRGDAWLDDVCTVP